MDINEKKGLVIIELISTFAARILKENAMNEIKEYHISFRGLKDGLHSFDFEIGKKFFQTFENTRIQDSNLKLDLELDKQETMLQVYFSIAGEVEVECDRCLELYTQAVEVEDKLIVKFGRETFEEAENILVLDEKEHKLQLEQYIYEFIMLSLPMRLIHPELEDGEPGCQPGFLETYNEQDDADEDEVIDPRWEALKKLK
ncbi:DUF177 domain-containing protein [Lentimicrobium sp. S6]|uniref:YceD family protein n=1 Tax=Lentimicrobium sp. S6 TaxID=2735872 RepID=UPI001553204D|nr:DUF177 domain-containing protein [Lentimicrobium sp. S6]NPD45137.1 DUF177 domain-containing protein [Lentimicrobium sp. S6]